MANRLSRRDFFKGFAAAAIGSATGAASSVALASEAMGHRMEGGGHGAMAPMGHSMSKEMIPRFDPQALYSPPPPLSGKQMGSVRTLSQPPLGYELDGNVKVFRLTAQPVRVFVTKGSSEKSLREVESHTQGKYAKFRTMPSQPKEMIAWGYNGQCPGPTLEATEGDRIRIVFKNELPEPSSIHWHGVELPFAQDGAAGYHDFNAFPPTLPGETHVYEFTLYQSGTLLYHTGFNVMKQEGLGLGGMLVVHPRNYAHRIDRDFAILLQQWNFKPGNSNPDITSMEVSFATFNGKAAPGIEMMRVHQGERVRIRIGNLSLMAHPIHLHGYVFKIVGTTGGPIPESAQWPEVTVNVPPGSTRDIEFIAWNPGTWRFHCHILHHIMNAMADTPMGIMDKEGMFTHLHVIPRDPNYNPRDPKAPWRHPSPREV